MVVTMVTGVYAGAHTAPRCHWSCSTWREWTHYWRAGNSRGGAWDPGPNGSPEQQVGRLTSESSGSPGTVSWSIILYITLPEAFNRAREKKLLVTMSLSHWRFKRSGLRPHLGGACISLWSSYSQGPLSGVSPPIILLLSQYQHSPPTL